MSAEQLVDLMVHLLGDPVLPLKKVPAVVGLSSETWQEREWSLLWSLLAECVPCILVRFKGEDFILFASPDQEQVLKNKSGLSMFMQRLLAATVGAEQ